MLFFKNNATSYNFITCPYCEVLVGVFGDEGAAVPTEQHEDVVVVV